MISMERNIIKQGVQNNKLRQDSLTVVYLNKSNVKTSVEFISWFDLHWLTSNLKFQLVI